MLTLSNRLLEVSVLHPLEDGHLLGPRYCSGCSIWQVSTSTGRALLAGPEYPAVPSVINGQGTPEVFQHTLFDDPESIPAARLIIGAGLVENSARRQNRESHWDSRVIEPCQWAITRCADSITMATSQHYQSWSFELHRDLRLEASTLHSTTLLRNLGRTELPFRWFAHPFFPFHEALRFHIENLLWPLPENPAFASLEVGAVALRKGYHWSNGYFLDLVDHRGMRFDARIEAPDQGAVRIQSSFPLLKLALWANDKTFSPEPFYAGRIGPGLSEQWSVSYTF